MRAEKRKGCFPMYEVLQRLKGVSCVLSVLSYQTETTQSKYQSECLEMLAQGIDSCIEELEKRRGEHTKAEA